MKRIVIHLINSKIYSGLEGVACDIIENVDSFRHIYVTQDGPVTEILGDRNIEYEVIKKMSIGELKRVIKKYNVDIIHAHDFTASCISAMSMVRKPIISHLHHNAPWLKKINIKTILYLICSTRFKKIFTVSPAIEKEYIFSKLIKNKIDCIFNPISVKKVTSKVTKEDYEKKYDICCVGRLTEAKDPIRWLNIIKEVKKENNNIKCIWVGDGELKDDFVAKINELGLQENVELPGFQQNPYKYLASSKIYLQTSAWEGFGLSAFESLALGVPAIVSNVGGLPMIVDDTCGKVCDSDEEFISSIIYILNEKKIIFDLSRAAFKKANVIDNLREYMNLLSETYNFYRRG